MLRAIVICLFAVAALAQPAAASWPFDGSSRHFSRRAAHRTLPEALGQILSEITGQTPARASGRMSGEISRRAAAKMSEQAAKYELMIALLASANGVPPSLVHRVIMRESGYNAHAVNSGNYGLMQIRLGTARALGYSGPAEGLLDPQTNITYAVRYLAGAYRAAGGNEDRAIALYASGY
jgi:soluble lytic murein transglycosylase-like protein